MNRYLPYGGLAATLLVLNLQLVISACGPTAEEAAEPEIAAAEAVYDPIALGRSHYLRYCASCHGTDGHGGGPVAEALKDVPTDITRLRATGEGVFSVDGLIEIIRGVKDVRAHGTREMPVWGNIWGEENLQKGTPQQIETRINELVEYIRSIQEPVESTG